MYVELNGPAGEGLAKAQESRPFAVFSYSLSKDGTPVYISIYIMVSYEETLSVGVILLIFPPGSVVSWPACRGSNRVIGAVTRVSPNLCLITVSTN